jgi:hypothetical protein
MGYRVNGKLVMRGERLMVIVPVFEEEREEVVAVVKRKRGWVKGRKRK